MIRIVGVQRSDIPGQEFLLLQNQGNMRAPMRGITVVAESYITGSQPEAFHMFRDEEYLLPGQYIALATGSGTPRWAVQDKGVVVYLAFMNRCQPLWNNVAGPFHVLNPHHTYTERREEALLR